MKEVIILLQFAYSLQKRKMIFSCVFVLLYMGLSLLPTILFSEVIDSYVDKTFFWVYVYLGLCIVSAAMSSIMTPLLNRYLMGFIHETVRELNVGWVQKILQKDYIVLQELGLGSLVASLDRGSIASERAINMIFQFIFPQILRIVPISGYLIYVGGLWLLPILGLCALGVWYFTRRFVYWRRPLLQRVNETHDSKISALTELFQAGKSIKISAAIETATLRLQSLYRSYASKATQLAFVESSLSSMQTFASFFTSFVVIICGLLAMQNHLYSSLSAGGFVILYTFSGYFISSMVSIMDSFTEADRYAVDSAALNDVLLLPSFREGKSHKSLDNYHLKIEPFHQEVHQEVLVVDDESKEEKSSLQARKSYVLANTDSIDIAHKTKVAIVGASGQGKSYFAEMLCGLRESQNKVFLADRDISELSSENLAQSFYLAEHQGSFLNGTFSQAVMFAKDISSQDTCNLLAKLSLDSFASYVDDEKRDFPVKNLSAGERRRFGLLRAILLKKPITILDEPTEALDADLGLKIWDVIFSAFKDHTLICLTHDTRYLHCFDMVVRIEDHRLQVERREKTK